MGRPVGTLLLSLIALATCSGYVYDRDYRYHVKGYLDVGFTRIKPHVAGLAFESGLVIQPQQGYYVMYFEDPKFDNFNRMVNNFEEEKFNYRTEEALASVLTKPFKVYAERGEFNRFYTSRDDPDWSVNIKKSVISLFQLNLEQNNPVKIPDHETSSRSEHDQEVFRVMEKDIGGNCETSYLVQSHPYAGNPYDNHVLNITKSKNYHNCDRVPFLVFFNFPGYPCEECPGHEPHVLHSNVFYHYNLRGSRHNYVVENATSEGELTYAPFTTNGQIVQIFHHENAELVSETVRQELKPLPTDIVPHYDLAYEYHKHYEFDELVDLKKPHHLHNIYNFHAPIPEVERLFGEIVADYAGEKYNDNFIKNNNTAKFLELVNAFGTLSYDDFEVLYTKYSVLDSYYLDLFFDALEACGTNPAFMFGKYLIQTTRVAPSRAQEFIVEITPHIKEVTEGLLDEYYRLCDNPAVRDHIHVHHHCLFSFAHLVRDKCVTKPYVVKDYHHLHRRGCTPEKAAKYYQYAIRHFDHKDESEATFYVKLIGAFGLKESFRDLKPFIEGNYPIQLRTYAIYALWHMGYYHLDQTVSLLFPIYFNHTEDYEIRITAYTMLAFSPLTLSHWEKIAFSVWDEPSVQVASYVYTSMKSLAKSEHPCFKEAARNVRHALTLLDYWHMDYREYDKNYAFHHLSSGYNKKYDYGGYSSFHYIPSNSSYIPRTLFFVFGDYIVGRNYDSEGFIFSAQGLEKYLDRLLGPEGPNKKGHSFFEFFNRRMRRDASSNVEKELSDIDKKLHINTRGYEKAHATIGYQLSHDYYHYYHFNETDIEGFFQNAPLIITGLIASANTLFPYASRGHHIGLDKTIMMFSHIGLPIALDLKEIIYDQDLVHDFKLSTEPDIFSQDNPDFSKVKKVGAHLDSHFAYERNFFMKLSVLQPYVQHSLGAGINKRCVVSLPIKMDFKLDLETEKFTLKWTPIPHHIVHTHYEPFTFIESHSDLKPLIHETTYIPMPSYQIEKINKDFGHDAFGLGIRVEADYLHEGNTVGDWYNFFMENDFRDRYYYYLVRPEFRPYHVDLYLTGANRDLTNEVELELGFDYIQPGSAENFAPKFDAGFEEEGRARGDLRWETLVLQALLTGRGQRERKVNAEISVSQSTDQIHHKWNIFYDRTPFSSKESDHFKLCLSSYLKYPKYDISKFFLLDTASQDNNMNAIIKTNFGRDCSTDSKVMIQGHLERTDYQKKLEAEREVPLTPRYHNVYGLNYQKCQKARAKGDMYNDYCRIYVDLASRLHKETWDVKFENIHDLLYNLSYRASDAFKHYYYPYAQVNHLAQNEAGHVKFLVEHHVHHTNRAHMTIYKPHETVRYDHIPFHYFIPVSPSPVSDHSEIGDDVANPKYPYCVIYGDHVRTFDNYTYDLPEIGCYKVLAKDCSPLQEFLILGAKVAGNDRFSKAFKAFFGGHKLEGLPTADGLILRMDGSRLAVPDNEPLIQLKPDGSELFHVHYNGFFYSIISELYGLKIYYDGNGIYIRPDFFYRGKLCGLCGDYNGDRQMELRGPDGCVYNNTATFSYSYAIPDDTCTVPKVHGACDTWRGAGCTVQRTHYIHVGTRNRQTCFSVTPITKCVEGCRASRLISRSLGFHCLPARDDFTRSLVRESEFRVLHELRRKSQDHYSEVSFAEGCVRP